MLLVCALPLCYRLITAGLSQCCHNLEDWLFLFHAALKCYMIHSKISTAGVDKYTRFSCEANNTKGITTSREAHVSVMKPMPMLYKMVADTGLLLFVFFGVF